MMQQYDIPEHRELWEMDEFFTIKNSILGKFSESKQKYIKDACSFSITRGNIKKTLDSFSKKKNIFSIRL